MRKAMAGVLFVALAVTGCNRGHRAPPAPEIEREDLTGRSRQWRALRAAPLTAVPEQAYARAVGAWNRLPSANSLPGFKLGGRLRPAFAMSWSQVGPAPLDETPALPQAGIGAGRMTALAIDPTNNQVLYAGYAMGGVWKSTNGGTSWVPLTDGELTLAVGAIALDPQNSQTIYVGTGESSSSGDSYYGQGILKSTNGGASWTLLGSATFANMSVSQIAVDPTLTTRLYATTIPGYTIEDPCASSTTYATGFFTSNDSGAHWSKLASGYFTGFSVDWTTASPRTFLLPDNYYGLYSFAEPTGPAAPFGNLPTNVRGLTVLRSTAGGRLFAGVGDGSTGALYTSPDNGATWTAVPGSPNYCGQQCYYDNILALSPGTTDTVYFGGALCPIWKGSGLLSLPGFSANSMPGNACPSNVQWWNSRIHPDTHVIQFDPTSSTTLYVGTDNGLVRTTDDGTTWQHLAANTATSQFYGLCVDPNDATQIFGGMQDSGPAKRSSGVLWSQVQTGDGGPCVVNRTTPTQVLVSTQNATLWKTTDRFATVPPLQVFTVEAASCATYGSCGDRSAFTAFPLVAHPTQANTVFLGTHRLWKSTNFGDSWAAFTGDLTAGATGLLCGTNPGQADYLTAVAIAPTSSLIYTGSAGGVLSQVSANGAQVATLSKVPLPVRYISGIALDPLNEQTVYVAYAGFNAGTPATPGHIFRSTNAGQSWQSIDAPGADIPFYSLVTHPTRSGVLFLGTDFGVMATPNAGGTWGQFGSGMPRVTVPSLVFHQGTNQLFAATHGRSAYSVQLPPDTTVTQVAPTHGPPDGGQTVTLTGTGFEDNAVVTVGGLDAGNVAAASATSLSFVTPAHASGVVNISLANLDGTGADAGSYTYDVVLHGLTPAQGSVAGGDVVSVYGVDFPPGTTLTFGGVPAGNVQVTHTLISGATPPHDAGAVDVVVTTPDLVSGTLPAAYTYATTLPDAGSAAGGKGGCGCGAGANASSLLAGIALALAASALAKRRVRARIRPGREPSVATPV